MPEQLNYGEAYDIVYRHNFKPYNGMKFELIANSSLHDAYSAPAEPILHPVILWEDHIHNHFIINSVGLDTGEKFQMYKDDSSNAKNYLMKSVENTVLKN